MTKVPVVRLDHLSEEQARLYMIAENRLAELSNWDDRNLAEALLDLSRISLNFDLEITGFEQPEIDFRIQSLQAGEEGDDLLSATRDLPARPSRGAGLR